MFRLVNFDEDSKVYEYLSVIASNTIYHALDNWMSDDDAVKAFYEAELEEYESSIDEQEDLEDYEDILSDIQEEKPVTGFFEGISEFIPCPDKHRWSSIDNRIISEDGRIGMEMIRRKIDRMMEKMEDPYHYYTFDLFEEFLFYQMTEYYEMVALLEGLSEDGIDPEEFEGDIEIEMEYETDDENILEAVRTLVEDYGVDEDEAVQMVYPVFIPELMTIDTDEENSMFFWDNDFLVFFSNGFVSGIRRMVSGMGAALGYRYENIRDIFTDIDFKAPLSLIGTETAYNLRFELIENQMAGDRD